MSHSTVVKSIPEDYTQYFLQYHKENKHNYDTFDYEEDDLFLRAWGLNEKSKISGHVLATSIHDNSEINLLVKKVLDLFDVEYNEFEAFIKTCYLPITLHVDANRYVGPVHSHNNWDGEELDLFGQGISIIIPLTFNKDIHTIIFKNMVGDNEYVRDFLDTVAGIYEESNNRNHRANLPIYEHNLDYRDYIPNIWNRQMIEHYHDPENSQYARGDQILDYLEVDVKIPWEKNVAYMFDKQKMHMSNNFKKFGIENKDFLLIHTH